MKNNILLIALFLLGVASRTIFHLGANIELITAISIASIYVVNNKKSLVLPLIIIAITDLIIGNSLVLLFTWTAYLFAPILASIIKRLSGNDYLKAEITGIIFTLLFFFWTNLGFALVTNIYPHSLSGIFQAYVNGLPFLRVQLLSNVILVPTLLIIAKLVSLQLDHKNTKLEVE